MSVNLSKEFPIHSITQKGLIVGDKKACLTIAFEMELPIIYTMGENQFQDMVDDFQKFIELLGEDILIHKQDAYHRAYFSIGNTDEEITSDFIESSYQTHFNERPYLKMNSYLFISKCQNPNTKITSNIISKDFLKTNEDAFIDLVVNASEILKKHNIYLKRLDKETLESAASPISKYFNFSNVEIEELKDLDFSNNSIFVGSKEIKIYSIQEEEQFPTENIKYCQFFNGLPVSNMYAFGYELQIPHIVNQYIYIPNQKDFAMELDKRERELKGFNVRGSNSDAYEDVITFKEKMSTLGMNGAYFHYNIMCFDESPNEIEKGINIAFNTAGFKKKEVTLSRKDLFWAGIGGNGYQLFMGDTNRKNLSATLLDLECAAFLNFEQNYSDDITSYNGVRLCDRIYGIPFSVDLFDTPKKKNMIKNQNTIVLAGSGGGKSFTTNLILLNQYRQGSHVFIIDASFSYKLQTAMHDGVYLTYDNDSKITFNPFYLDWMKDANAKKIFTETKSTGDDYWEKYTDFLESKISMLSGLLGSMTKSKDEQMKKFESSVYRILLNNYFRHRCLNNLVDQCKFDDFYEFIKVELPIILNENQIERADFNPNTFLMMLSEFCTGNSLGYLLNSEDEKIKNLDKERFIVIDVSKIRENETLFPIISALSMDLYNQKVSKLDIGIKKILCIDEAWQAISSPDMAVFMKSQVKVIRKYGGLTIFISQELDDFVSSEIIKESIINNSAIKIFADMGEYKQKFEPIKKTLAISDNNEVKIKSLNQKNRKNSFYKEICICWEQYAQVYAVETPLELKAIFETDPDEVAKILPQYKEYGVELTAINYANRA